MIKEKSDTGITKKLGRIPEGWSSLEFDEFVERSKKSYSNKRDKNNYKCIELEHINQNTGSINGWVNSVNQKSTKNRFIDGQILFGKLRPYLRKFWKAYFSGVCSTEIWVLDGKKTKSLNDFLFYFIQSNRFIQAANATTGSKMPRADWWYVSKVPFLLPPLPEQQKIAQILSTWDKAIALQDQLIKEKQALKKGLMQQLLTGKKRFAGFEEEWEVVEFDNIAERTKGKFNCKTESLSERCLELEHLNQQTGSINGWTDSQNQKSIKNKFLVGQILFGKLRPYLKKFWQAEFSGVCSSEIWVLDSKKNICTNNYLFYLVQTNRFIQIANATSGSKMPRADWKYLSKFPFKLPGLNEQKKIAAILSSLDVEIEHLQQHKKAFIQQKQGLMQQLLSGEVRVKI